jgi:hypothetical protein
MGFIDHCLPPAPSPESKKPAAEKQPDVIGALETSISTIPTNS